MDDRGERYRRRGGVRELKERCCGHYRVDESGKRTCVREVIIEIGRREKKVAPQNDRDQVSFDILASEEKY